MRSFDEVLRAGLREVAPIWLRLFGVRLAGRRLLSLTDLTRQVPPRGQHYGGLQQVNVGRIIGSEDRSEDFTATFLPTNSALGPRWTRVRDLLLGGQLNRTIEVVEFGGYFFVRDGHHRVSVAKAHHVEFLDAEVVRFALPVRLLPRMTMAKLPLLQAKLAFHDETGLFDVVPAEDVGDAHPESWEFLRAQVLTDFPRLLGIEGELPDARTILARWFDGPHRIIRDYMRSEVALLLFPGRYELDVICDVLQRWQRVGQETSLVAAYREAIRVARRRRPFAAVAQRVRRTLRRTVATAAEEYDRFMRVTRLHRLRPDAQIARGHKDWYRTLLRQLLVTYAGYLRNREGHPVGLEQLVGEWYDDVYAPALRAYRAAKIDAPFSVVYMRWIVESRRAMIRAVKELGYVPSMPFADSFARFLSDELGAPPTSTTQ